MTKTEKIVQWLDGQARTRRDGSVRYGALTLGETVCDIASVYTYDSILAVIDRSTKTAHVNMQRYSVTSSGHRNRTLEALELAGYDVTEVDSEAFLKDILEAVMFGDSGVDEEWIDESEIVDEEESGEEAEEGAACSGPVWTAVQDSGSTNRVWQFCFRSLDAYTPGSASLAEFLAIYGDPRNFGNDEGNSNGDGNE